MHSPIVKSRKLEMTTYFNYLKQKTSRKKVLYRRSTSACAEKNIYSELWRGQTCRSSELWTDLEREPVRLATTKTLGVCTRYFNPNYFKHSLAATSALAGFQSTFLRTLRRAKHEIIVEIE